jgi:hypothetical protein
MAMLGWDHTTIAQRWYGWIRVVAGACPTPRRTRFLRFGEGTLFIIFLTETFTLTAPTTSVLVDGLKLEPRVRRNEGDLELTKSAIRGG